MSLLKQRIRLRSVSNLNSILSAMQIVTMVRMQRTREKNTTIESYLAPIREVLEGRIHKRKTKKKFLIIVSSSRGLCGSFNSSLFKKAEEFIKKNPNLTFVSIGKKSDDFLRRKKHQILFSAHELIEKHNYENACNVFKKIFNEDREIYVAYNSYQTGAYYFPVIRKIYPVPYEIKNIKHPVDIILEPNPEELVKKLFYHYLETSFYQIMINSQISEFTARLMVLKSSVSNSKELIGNLVVSINKTRQADITKDLSEIVASVQVFRRADDE